MTNYAKEVEAAAQARDQAIASIGSIAHLLAAGDLSPRAKVFTARAIIHLGQAAEDLANLRGEIAHP